MNKEVQVVVVTPDAASGKKSVACPTIYLLHGYGGNAKTWIDIKPNLPQIRSKRNHIGLLRNQRPVGTGIVRGQPVFPL